MASISCLLLSIGVSLGAATGDCSGSSCLPRSSLLQVKSNARRQSASTETHSSLKARLAEYTKFTENLVAKYGEDPPEASRESYDKDPTPEELEAVRVVLEFIDDMYQSLLGWHQADVVKAQQCSTEAIIESCQLNGDQSAGLVTLRQKLDEQSDNHTQCRDSCYELANRDSCPDYDSYRKDEGQYAGEPVEAKLPPCVLAPKWAFADASIQTTDMAQLAIMEECLEETKKWLDPLYGKYKNCSRHENNINDCIADCSTKQTVFEEGHCLWYAQTTSQCGSVSQCGEDETAECLQECDDIQVREDARKADNETGQRLVCLLHVIFGSPVDVNDPNTAWIPRPTDKQRPQALDACKGANYVPPDWSITCNPASPFVVPPPCDHQDIPTCGTGFHQTWYEPLGLLVPCLDQCTKKEQALQRRVDQCTLTDGGCFV